MIPQPNPKNTKRNLNPGGCRLGDPPRIKQVRIRTKLILLPNLISNASLMPGKLSLPTFMEGRTPLYLPPNLTQIIATSYLRSIRTLINITTKQGTPDLAQRSFYTET